MRRLIHEHDRLVRHAVHDYTIADDARVLYIQQTDASSRDCRWARDLLAEFQRLWDHAEPDQQLRRLALNG